MSGYVRPRLTDQQARLLQMLANVHADDEGERLQDRQMWRRAALAIDDAFEQREQRAEQRRTVRDRTPEPVEITEADVHVPGDPWPGPNGGYVR